MFIAADAYFHFRHAAAASIALGHHVVAISC